MNKCLYIKLNANKNIEHNLHSKKEVAAFYTIIINELTMSKAPLSKNSLKGENEFHPFIHVSERKLNISSSSTAKHE